MRAPTLDLTLLRTLVAIADTGSVTAAAKRLAYTQSTVSMQLQRMEAQLSLTLHEREGRRIRFTSEGARLLNHARRLLALNDEAWSDMQARQVTGDRTLGIPEDYASPLHTVVDYYHQPHPAPGPGGNGGQPRRRVRSAGDLGRCQFHCATKNPAGRRHRPENVPARPRSWRNTFRTPVSSAVCHLPTSRQVVGPGGHRDERADW